MEERKVNITSMKKVQQAYTNIINVLFAFLMIAILTGTLLLDKDSANRFQSECISSNGGYYLVGGYFDSVIKTLFIYGGAGAENAC